MVRKNILLKGKVDETLTAFSSLNALLLQDSILTTSTYLRCLFSQSNVLNLNIRKFDQALVTIKNNLVMYYISSCIRPDKSNGQSLNQLRILLNGKLHRVLNFQICLCLYLKQIHKVHYKLYYLGINTFKNLNSLYTQSR